MTAALLASSCVGGSFSLRHISFKLKLALLLRSRRGCGSDSATTRDILGAADAFDMDRTGRRTEYEREDPEDRRETFMRVSGEVQIR